MYRSGVLKTRSGIDHETREGKKVPVVDSAIFIFSEVPDDVDGDDDEEGRAQVLMFPPLSFLLGFFFPAWLAVYRRGDQGAFSSFLEEGAIRRPSTLRPRLRLMTRTRTSSWEGATVGRAEERGEPGSSPGARRGSRRLRM